MAKKSQPDFFYHIAFINLWQRFGFYMLQAILVLYMVQFFQTTPTEAYQAFAVTSSLLYLFPILGGYVGDKILDAKTCVMLGAVISAIGYFMMAVPNKYFLYNGLATLVIGTGLFMPNIASMLAELYHAQDMRREAGFSIFYTFINIGAFFPPLIGAFLIDHFGWSSVFLLSGVTIIFGVILFQAKNIKKINFDIWHWLKICIVILLSFFIILFLIILVLTPWFTNNAVLILSALVALYIIKKSMKFSGVERTRLLACLILITFSVVFEVLYGQAGMSLTMFTQFNTARTIHGVTISTVVFRSLNPFFIIVLGPLFAKGWIWLSKKNSNPSTPVKFGLGTILMGLGFVVLPLAMILSDATQLNFWWLVLSYFLQTVGELLVSPIGLSMTSELSPKSMIGVMMGAWYFATAVANAIAGKVSVLTALPSGSNDPIITAHLYSEVFATVGFIAIIIGVLILLLSKIINKMTNGKVSNI